MKHQKEGMKGGGEWDLGVEGQGEGVVGDDGGAAGEDNRRKRKGKRETIAIGGYVFSSSLLSIPAVLWRPSGEWILRNSLVLRSNSLSQLSLDASPLPSIFPLLRLLLRFLLFGLAHHTKAPNVNRGSRPV